MISWTASSETKDGLGEKKYRLRPDTCIGGCCVMCRCGGKGSGGKCCRVPFIVRINEDRERKAEYLLRLASGGPGSILLVYIIYYMICAGRSTTQPTDDRLSTILQLMMALVPSVLVPIVPHLMRLLLARIARRVIIQPVTVTCPC